MFSLYLGFLLGAVTIIVVEVLGLLYILKVIRKKKDDKVTESQVSRDLDSQQSLSVLYNKQGPVWVLEPEKVPKVWPQDKVKKEPKNKKEILEVLPVKKQGKIKDSSLILTDSDASQATIQLLGCIIVAVSASELSSRKWAKRYPIKVESKNSIIYKGSRTCYIYLETSWEKESWCKALRLASCIEKEKVKRFTKLSEEFHDYLTSLNAGYPSFMKPYTGFGGSTDRAIKLDDGSSSKVRLLLKKLKRKASKSGIESKASGVSSGRVERKLSDKSRPVQDLFSATGSVKTTLTEKTTNSSLEENIVLPLPSTSNQSGSQSQGSVISDAESDDKFGIDEGTLGWNLLISRLFFDAKKNEELKRSIHARIQRTLSNMRTPSFIGGITCTGLDLGNLPLYIHTMRVLPMDMNEVWSMEMDIEYSGGMILDIETRLEVREPEFQKSIVDTSLESSSVGEVTSDLLEDFENFGSQLKLSKEIVDTIQAGDEGGNKLDRMKNSKSNGWKSTYASRWKGLLNTIADHVSQVPLSLGIRVSSLRGTLQLHIKPPPSDQLWFGFTSMPDVEFNLESSVGEHKITSGHVALLLGNRFKEAIRQTLVLPNCESVCVPWMLAEKDDWVPREVAPFIWTSQDATSDTAVREELSCQLGDARTKLEPSKTSMPSSSNYLDKSKLEGKGSKQNPSNPLEDKPEKPRDDVRIQQPTNESLDESASSQRSPSSSSSANQSSNSESLQELRIPLLGNGGSHDSYNLTRPESPECQPPPGAMIVANEQYSFGEDLMPKKIGRRARMGDLRKKMGEKLEEKRRHIEEKGRNIVEKMRGP